MQKLEIDEYEEEVEEDSTFIHEKPLHIRSREEKWELPRNEIAIKSKMGEGQGGIIYLAEWRGMQVVAKMLHLIKINEDVQYSSIAYKDMINEISILSHLRHPNLVMFLGAVTVAMPLVIINEFMPGGSVEKLLDTKRREQNGQVWRPPRHFVKQWSLELLLALCFLHNCNPPIIHRDLKPANLLIDADIHLKVGDFGLGKVKEMRKIYGTYTMTGKTGSMRYMAPEVFSENPFYDEKVDIYSASMVLWVFCHGEKPFITMNADKVASLAFTDGLRPNLKRVHNVVGSKYAALVEKSWDVDPNIRPSAKQLVFELRCLLGSRTPKERCSLC